ncbi:MAG: InlB B-repeat-containing protein [Anaerovoracaceae bacterium]
MRRRILSIMLSICMVLALVPTMAFAANTDTTDLQNKLTAGGTVKLTKDYTIDATLMVSKDVTLDLNGYVIEMTGSGSVIKVDHNVSLTLQDSRPTAAHNGKNLPAGGVLTGGSVGYNSNYRDGGGGVNVYSGSFTMNGGTIYGCTAQFGGGVNIVSGSFTMNGGTIYGCTAQYGGGVRIAPNNTFTMTGGVIENCAASTPGDAVSSAVNANFLAYGGIIMGTVSLNSNSTISNTNNSSCTRFYGLVVNGGTTSGGIYYGGISSGTVTGNYKTVSFDLNGGMGYVPTQWFFNVSTARALRPANPTKEGYQSFAGWYNGGTKYDFTQPVTNNITLTARFSNPKTYNISYDLNGGTATNPTSYTVESGAIRLNNPTKPGYTFTGWSGTDLIGADNMTVTISKGSTGDRAYIANWTPDTYGITYNLNGGTATNPTDYTVESEAITLNNPTKPGYTFTGWSGTGLTGTNNTNVTISKGSTGDRAYIANWTPDTYGITYNLNGGTATNPTDYTAESEAITLNNPTKSGYTFTGWSGTDLTGADNMTVTIPKGSTGNREYTANWKLDTYGITYELNGGATTNPTSYTVESEATTLNNPTKPGYTFTGWSGTDLTGADNMTVTIPKGSTGNREYTANWTPKNYVVTLNTNGGKINSGNVTDYTYGQGATLPTDVTKAGYTFKGWYDNETFTGDPVTTISDTDTEKKEYWAKWAAVSYPSISQKPTVEAGEGVKVTLSADGTVATITVDDGYELADVVLNGVSKGKVNEIKGIKTGDKLVVTAAKKETEPTDPAKEEILAKLNSYELVTRSTACKSPSGKNAIRIRVYDKNGLSTDFFDGIEIYRSTKSNSGYGKKPIFVIKSGKSSYYNTAIKSGTRYYYKVRGFVIIDGQKYYTDWSLKAIRTAK